MAHANGHLNNTCMVVSFNLHINDKGRLCRPFSSQGSLQLVIYCVKLSIKKKILIFGMKVNDHKHFKVIAEAPFDDEELLVATD